MADRASVLLVRNQSPRTLILKPPQNISLLSLVLEPSVGAEQQGCSCRFQHQGSIDWNGFTPLLTRPVYGSLGVIQVENDVFLCVVSDSIKVLEIEGHQIYRILSVRFFSIFSSKYDAISRVESPESQYSSDVTSPFYHPCAPLQKLICNGSFYFSHTYNLTESTQKRFFNSCLAKTPAPNHSPLEKQNSDLFISSVEALEHLDMHFVWNQFMLKPLNLIRDQLDPEQREMLAASGLLTIAISGFIGSSVFRSRGTHYRIAIMSRVSCKRAGARFLARGVDDQGNVSNFVETEFLILGPRFTFAFLQVRGSIPLFWEQQGIQMTHKIDITRSPEATAPAFRKHFEELLDRYTRVHIVNLLKQEPTANEYPLSEGYRQHLVQMKDLRELIPFTRFDFHAIVGRDSYERLSLLSNQLQNAIEEYGYFLYDHDSETIIVMQNGVFRTNCLDCLDRTNVVQSAISKTAVQGFFGGLGIEMQTEGLLSGFNELWADNGDWLSRIYAGTGALKSSVTRKGKTTVLGFLDDAAKSMNRFVISNFQDKSRQEAIDTLLGKIVPRTKISIENPTHSSAMKEVTARSAEFTTFDTIKCFVATFNVNGKLPRGDLTSWLKSSKYPAPEIYVIGIQELIELTAGQMVTADTTKLRITWENALLDCINSLFPFTEYVVLRSTHLVALAMFVFVRSDNVQSIKRVEVSMKKTGLGGMAGNKGGIGISLSFWDTQMVFVTAHLAAGQTNVEDRNQDVWTINEGLNFRGKNVYDHEICWWFGDFNYRVNLPNETIRGHLNTPKVSYTYLLKHDQLYEQRADTKVFDLFEEAEIQFPPTYKYDVGTNTFDSSEKMRAPAWTDRILFKGRDIKNLEYSSSMDIFMSDHKPIHSLFEVTVKRIDHEKVELIQAQIYKKLSKGIKEAALVNQMEKVSVQAPPLPTRPSKVGVLIDVEEPATTKWWEAPQEPLKKSPSSIPTASPKSSASTASPSKPSPAPKPSSISAPKLKSPRPQSAKSNSVPEPKKKGSGSESALSEKKKPPAPPKQSKDDPWAIKDSPEKKPATPAENKPDEKRSVPPVPSRKPPEVSSRLQDLVKKFE